MKTKKEIHKPVRDCWVLVKLGPDFGKIHFESNWKHCEYGEGRDQCTCKENIRDACCCTHKTEYMDSQMHKKVIKITELNKKYGLI